MATYFKVLGNIKHNGQAYDKGSILSGELAEYQSLLEDGVLAIIDGAETLEEAETIANIEAPAVEEEASVEPENTWEAKPDEPENDDNATPEVSDEPVEYTGPMVKVKFIKDYEVINEHGEKTGEVIKEGTESEVPEPTVEYLVEAGEVEVIVEETINENGVQVDAPLEENE